MQETLIGLPSPLDLATWPAPELKVLPGWDPITTSELIAIRKLAGTTVFLFFTLQVRIPF